MGMITAPAAKKPKADKRKRADHASPADDESRGDDDGLADTEAASAAPQQKVPAMQPLY